MVWYGVFVAKEHQTIVQRDFHFFMLNLFLIFQYIHILKIILPTEVFNFHNDSLGFFFFQRSVQVLNIAGNNLDSIRDVECLRNLYQLHANDNLLTDMKELAHVVGGMFRLWRLDLMGNPLCHKAKYRDRVIVMAKNLGKKLRMVKFFIGALKKG